MGSLRQHEGYVFIDRGIGPGMQRLGNIEMVCFTCPHCNFVTVGKNRADRGYCSKCDHWLCNKPACNAECNPILRDVSLAQRFPDAGQPFLPRGPRGEVLYDPRFIDKERVF